jgi:hypothetical protein
MAKHSFQPISSATSLRLPSRDLRCPSIHLKNVMYRVERLFHLTYK